MYVDVNLYHNRMEVLALRQGKKPRDLLMFVFAGENLPPP